MTLPQRPPKVWIISSSPIYARGLQTLVESSPTGWYSETLLEPGLLPSSLDTPSAIVLIAPRDWQELGSWLPPLQKRRLETAWVVLAELQTVGLFLPKLDSQPCVVVDRAGTSEELSAALRAAAADDGWHLPTTVLSRFMRRKAARPNGRTARMPSITELAICCGVSLGLSNPEIAEALCLSEATVKTHLHRLMMRMGVDRRATLGGLVQRVLAHQPLAHELDAYAPALTH